MAKADSAAKKKRTRRRKRREVSESSSSDDSGTESEGAVKITVERTAPVTTASTAPKVAEESSVDTDSDESESSDEDEPTTNTKPAHAEAADVEMAPAEPVEAPQPRRRLPSRSPSPPSPTLPPFLPKETDPREEKEKLLRERFRKYWMASLADGFADDLDEIRKEPSMTKSRLEMLIDSLASGADVFSSSVDENSRKRTMEEMELVLGER